MLGYRKYRQKMKSQCKVWDGKKWIKKEALYKRTRVKTLTNKGV